MWYTGCIFCFNMDDPYNPQSYNLSLGQCGIQDVFSVLIWMRLTTLKLSVVDRL